MTASPRWCRSIRKASTFRGGPVRRTERRDRVRPGPRPMAEIEPCGAGRTVSGPDPDAVVEIQLAGGSGYGDPLGAPAGEDRGRSLKATSRREGAVRDYGVVHERGRPHRSPGHRARPARVAAARAAGGVVRAGRRADEGRDATSAARSRTSSIATTTGHRPLRRGGRGQVDTTPPTSSTASAGAGAHRPPGRHHRLLRPRHDRGHQRADGAHGRHGRPDHDGRLPRRPGDRARQPAGPVQLHVRQAAAVRAAASAPRGERADGLSRAGRRAARPDRGRAHRRAVPRRAGRRGGDLPAPRLRQLRPRGAGRAGAPPAVARAPVRAGLAPDHARMARIRADLDHRAVGLRPPDGPGLSRPARAPPRRERGARARLHHAVERRRRHGARRRRQPDQHGRVGPGERRARRDRAGPDHRRSRT